MFWFHLQKFRCRQVFLSGNLKCRDFLVGPILLRYQCREEKSRSKSCVDNFFLPLKFLIGRYSLLISLLYHMQARSPVLLQMVVAVLRQHHLLLWSTAQEQQFSNSRVCMILISECLNPLPSAKDIMIRLCIRVLHTDPFILTA